MSGDLDRRRLIELVGLLLDELASDEQVRELDAMLVHSAEARQLYRVCLGLHRDLDEFGSSVGVSEDGGQTHTRDDQGEVEALPFALPDSQPNVAKSMLAHSSITDQRALGGRMRSTIFRFAAAAVLLLVAGVVVALLTRGTETSQPEVVSYDRSPVAMLTNESGAVWESGSGDSMLDPGAPIEPGRLRLRSGSVEMVMNSTAMVTLIGPAEMEVLGPNSCRLTRGVLLAAVPERAHGFTVQTPAATVVDLGTEFGVIADADATELHVFKGRVRATPTGGEAGMDYAGPAAVRIRGSAAPIALRTISKAEFVDETSARGPYRYAHWSFDRVGAEEHLAGDGRGFDIDALAARFTRDNRTVRNATPPRLVEGRFGNAVAFTGDGDAIVTGFDGIGGVAPRTVAMWVKAPVDWARDEGFTLVHWGVHKEAGGHRGEVWQVSINSDESSGPIGRLRVGVGVGLVVGSTDLRDGRWHHIAAVFRGGVDSDLVTHTSVYVDGQVEPISASVPEAVKTNVQSADRSPVTFGKNIADRLDKLFQSRGAIDEVYLFDAALAAHDRSNV